MLNRFSSVLGFVVLAASSTSAVAQTQSQYSTQNNGSTYQSQYQVNGANGAGQGSGSGGSQAQADYNASAALRSAPRYPQGSVQTQQQQMGAWPPQSSTTTAPVTPAPKGTARPM
jgi:hypothetical protein